MLLFRFCERKQCPQKRPSLDVHENEWMFRMYNFVVVFLQVLQKISDCCSKKSDFFFIFWVRWWNFAHTNLNLQIWSKLSRTGNNVPQVTFSTFVNVVPTVPEEEWIFKEEDNICVFIVNETKVKIMEQAHNTV